MPQWFDKLKTNLGLNEDGEAQQEQTLLQQMNEATTLDRTQVGAGRGSVVETGQQTAAALAHPGSRVAREPPLSCPAASHLLQRAIGFLTCVGIGLLLSFMVGAAGAHARREHAAGQSGSGALRCFSAPCTPAASAARSTSACVGPALQAPMFIFRPTKFAMIYSLGNVLSMCRYWGAGRAGAGAVLSTVCTKTSCLPACLGASARCSHPSWPLHPPLPRPLPAAPCS